MSETETIQLCLWPNVPNTGEIFPIWHIWSQTKLFTISDSLRQNFPIVISKCFLSITATERYRIFCRYVAFLDEIDQRTFWLLPSYHICLFIYLCLFIRQLLIFSTGIVYKQLALTILGCMSWLLNLFTPEVSFKSSKGRQMDHYAMVSLKGWLLHAFCP